MSDYATERIGDIYREGNVDIVFFGELLCAVSTRQCGEGEPTSYRKPPDECMTDAVKLAEFMVSSGDFYAQRGHRHDDGSFSYLLFERGFIEFADFVWRQFSGQWIDDFDLMFTTSLVKRLPGKRTPVLPVGISALLSG